LKWGRKSGGGEAPEMQDEVNEKLVALCISGGRISAQKLQDALAKMMGMAERGLVKTAEASYHGKQSMGKLKARGLELSNIEVTDGNIKSFGRYARKYGVDYCLKKDRTTEPPRYFVFFRAKDVDSMTAAFKEYAGRQLKKEKKPSVRAKLTLAMERAMKNKGREKTMEKAGDRAR